MLTLVMSVTVWAQKVSLDFTNAKTDWGMPTSGVKNEAKTYTNGEYSITIWGDASNGHKAQSGYIITGKKGAYIVLPKMDFSVGKIIIGGRSGASASTQFNVYVGEEAVSTSATGCTTDNTFDIAEEYQTAGTEYTIKVESAHNLQVTRVDFYEAGSAPEAVAVESVSLDQNTASLFVGEMVTLTATVLPEDATNKKITWTSSNEEVATVDASGVVTAVAAGSSNITVTTVDGEYTAVCTVVVKEEEKSGTIYTKVTEDLTDWTGTYLIVYEPEGKALDGSLGSGLDKAFNTVNVTPVDGKIEGTSLVDNAAITIEAVEGGYALVAKDVYFGISSYGNGLKVNASTPYVNEIEVDAEENIVISQTFASGTMIMCFNANSSDKRFRYYKEGSQKKIQLYKLESAEPASCDVTVSAAGYATFYDSMNAVVLPEGMTAMVADNSGAALEFAEVYESGDVVPAGEPVVLKAAAGTYTLNYTTSTEDTWKSIDMNALCGTDVAATTTAEGDCYFYALQNGSKGVGFYWMNETGAAFTNGAHKAYLALPKTSAVRTSYIFDDATAISTLNAEEGEAAIFNLVGQRVQEAKGLVIMNGKKSYIK